MFVLAWVVSIVATIIIASNKKLSVAGFVFLSIFLGPIALIIVLLLPDESSSVSSQANLRSLSDARNQLDSIKHSMGVLQKRIETLENAINQSLAKKEPDAGKLTVNQAADSESNPQSFSQETKESFELVFGRYWLNRIGVILFVLGSGFFISYAFQYLGATAKILLGFLAALGFLAWGRYLEKNDKYRKVSWGISGGGWAILYLSTYAMHYIEATRIIHNPVLALWLLALVSIAAVIYNLRYQSWVATFLTFLLAFITTGLGSIDYSSVIYCAFVITAIVYLSYKFQWYYFLLYSLAGCYITYFYWLNPRIFGTFLIAKNTTIPIYQFQVGFGVLLISWTLFSLVLFLLEANEKSKRQCLVLGNVLNAGFYIVLGLREIGRVTPYLSSGWDMQLWFLIATGIVYLLFGYLYKNLRLARLVPVCLGIAATIFGMAVFIKCPKLSIAFFWTLEMVILFVLGVYYEERLYRVLGAFLATFIFLRLFIVDFLSSKEYAALGMYVKHNILIFLFAAACFFCLGALSKNAWVRARLPKQERNVYHIFTFAATILLVFIIGRESKEKWLSLQWALQGVATLAAGLLLHNKAFRWCALSVFTLASLRVIFIDIAGLNTVYKIMAFMFLGIIFLGVSLIYSRIKNEFK